MRVLVYSARARLRAVEATRAQGDQDRSRSQARGLGSAVTVETPAVPSELCGDHGLFPVAYDHPDLDLGSCVFTPHPPGTPHSWWPIPGTSVWDQEASHEPEFSQVVEIEVVGRDGTSWFTRTASYPPGATVGQVYCVECQGSGWWGYGPDETVNGRCNHCKGTGLMWVGLA